MRYTDCCTVGKGSRNQDGYYRIVVGSRTDNTRRFVMRHRFFWEESNGVIPEGLEINHKCRNRACYNVDHLELVTRTEHAIMTNLKRYHDVKLRGLEMLALDYSKEDVALSCERSVHTVNRWLREFKEENK